MGWSYARAGVDREKVKAGHSAIENLIRDTYRFRTGKFGEVLEGFGHYASLIDIGEGRALALHCDGCGTKVLIAQLMNKFDTIGIDCVAMCVNDIICVGAEPTVLIDYLALERPDKEMIHDIVKGLVKAAEKTRTPIIGGETAIMPDVIKGAVPGKGFDLAASCLGLVDKDKIVMGARLEPGDIILGVESSGIHSNGFSLARKVLLEEAKLKLDRKYPSLERTLGEELLEPTHIYLDPVLSTIKRTETHALAHITGGGFTKLRRFESKVKVGFHIDMMPEPKPIFKLIQDIGKISHEEMYRTFNMGIGLCIMAPKRSIDDVVSSFEAFGFSTYNIGRVVEEPGVRIEVGGRTVPI
ncbi:MAG: phosphoribosylformylglycinamidine cyclo-ligase [Candidatus Bathyarchaeia archaeon]